jgi:hypothetical protein
MSAMNELEFDTAIREVIKRTVMDSAFRAKALVDPKGALETVSTKSAPLGVSLLFIDNHGKSTKTIVLPDPVQESEELTESDLEEVAGGCNSSCIEGSCVTT